jgi:hypothetical protein
VQPDAHEREQGVDVHGLGDVVRRAASSDLRRSPFIALAVSEMIGRAANRSIARIARAVS